MVEQNEAVALKKTKRLLFGSLLVCIVLLVILLSNIQIPSLHTITDGISQSTSSLSLKQQTKTVGCATIGPLPDGDCTPGAVFGDITSAEICRPGYSSSVRDVPTSEKNKVYSEYGITTHTEGQYEVDHLVSLELGGSNDISNLWPEAANPKPGFHEKDKLENYLHTEICAGRISLSKAQEMIADDWLAAYQTYIAH